MKPLFRWGNSKTYDINMIMPFLPIQYTKYIEPFAGSASLFFHLDPHCESVLNDIDEEVMNFYEQISAGHSAQIKNFMDNTPNTKEMYYRILHNYCPTTPIEQASQFYYIRKTCHRASLRYNSSGQFNVAYGNNQNIDYSGIMKPEYKSLLQNVELTNRDFQDIFLNYNSPDYFMFLDPPAYESRKNEQFKHDDHMRLYKLFVDSECKCLMILKDCPFIKELYKEHIIAAYPMQGGQNIGTKLILCNLI